MSRLHPSVRDALAREVAAARGREVAAARGREVCFVATVGPDGLLTAIRVAARGTPDMVLALPGFAAYNARTGAG